MAPPPPARQAIPAEVKKFVRGGGAEGEVTRDFVAAEEPLEIRIGYTREGRRVRRSLSVTMRSPGHDRELALGFLLTEGIIAGAGDVEAVDWVRGEEREGEPGPPGRGAEPGEGNRVLVDLAPGVAVDLKRLERHFYTTSSCGVCGKASLEALKIQGCPVPPPEGPRFDPAWIRGLPDALLQAQEVFGSTGGLHAAALFEPGGEALVVREDIGRHNAVDKVIGSALLEGEPPLPLHHSLLLVSGRSSFEIVQKALAAGIPAVAAVGAPSSLAVEVANAFSMTLIGFLRAGRFNLYSGARRVGPATP